MKVDVHTYTPNLASSFVSSDLITLFIGPPKQRTACPICQQDGHDTTGDHLSIGEGHVYCFRDSAHGDELWKKLKQMINPQRSLPIHHKKPVGVLSQAAYDDPNGAFFDVAYSDKQGRDSVSESGERYRLEVEYILRAAADDADQMNHEGLERILRSTTLQIWRHTRETFELSYASGRCLTHLRHSVKHGDWKPWLQERNLTYDQASRMMKIASVPWNEIKHCNSVSAAIEYVDRNKPRRPRKDQILAAAQEKEITELKRNIEDLMVKAEEKGNVALRNQRDQLTNDKKYLLKTVADLRRSKSRVEQKATLFENRYESERMCREAAEQRNRQLEALLNLHGIPVPDDLKDPKHVNARDEDGANNEETELEARTFDERPNVGDQVGGSEIPTVASKDTRNFEISEFEEYDPASEQYPEDPYSKGG